MGPAPGGSLAVDSPTRRVCPRPAQCGDSARVVRTPWLGAFFSPQLLQRGVSGNTSFRWGKTAPCLPRARPRGTSACRTKAEQCDEKKTKAKAMECPEFTNYTKQKNPPPANRTPCRTPCFEPHAREGPTRAARRASRGKAKVCKNRNRRPRSKSYSMRRPAPEKRVPARQVF